LNLLIQQDSWVLAAPELRAWKNNGSALQACDEADAAGVSENGAERLYFIKPLQGGCRNSFASWLKLFDKRVTAVRINLKLKLMIFCCLFFSLKPAYSATPEIYSITPDQGDASQETRITINGENFEAGSRVYVGAGGLEIQGSVDTFYPDSAQDVFVHGNYAYVAALSSGLHIIDIADPENLSAVASVDTASDAYGVYVQGNYAYVAASLSGLQIIDVADPANPAVVATLDTPGYAYKVYVQGNYAYAATSSGLQIIDVADPENPAVVSILDTPGGISGVYIRGNYAYAAASYFNADLGGLSVGMLQIINIADPENPVVVSILKTPEEAIGVYIQYNYAYLAAGDAGLQIIDIADPAKPNIVTSVDTIYSAQDVFVQGNYAYVETSPSLWIIDIVDPANPAVVASVDHGDYSFEGQVYVQNDYAYVTTGASSLQAINIAEFTSPAIVASVYTSNYAYRVYAQGNYAYVSTFSSDLEIIDIADPANPSVAATLDISALGVYVLGNYAYAAAFSSGLQIIDVADPANPSVVASVNTPDNAHDVYVQENYAYVAASEAGLQIIDIADPENPSVVASVDIPSRAYEVYVQGNYAYVATQDAGLQIIDVSDPTMPTFVSSVDTPNSAGVYVSGSYAYVAADESGLQIIDIADPLNPAVVASVINYDYAADVCVQGNYAYVATSHAGLQIIDIADPANPAVVENVHTPNHSFGVYVQHGYAYVATSEAGIQIIDLKSAVSESQAVDFIDANTIEAVIPKGLLPGAYDIRIVSQSGGGTVLPNAFTVQSDEAGPKADHQTVETDEDAPLQTNLTASNPQGGQLAFSIERPPDHGSLTGTAPNLVYTPDPDYNGWDFFTFKVNDGTTDSNTAKVVITVKPVNDAPPEISGTPAVAVVEGSYYSFKPAAYDLDPDDFLRFSIVNKPPWATFNANTGALTGTPDSIDVGTTTAEIVITATDFSNAFASLPAFDLTVLAAPVINSISPTQGGKYKETSITIKGVNFEEGSRVYVGAKQACIQAGANTPGYSYGVYVQDGYAYLADGDSGLQIVDIADPAKPKIIGSVNTPDYAYGVYVKGNYAYVADRDSGLQIIDIADPAKAMIVASVGSFSYAKDVFVSGNYAYAATFSGLQIVDVADPANPAVVAKVDRLRSTEGIYVQGNYAYVSGNKFKVPLYDYPDPTLTSSLQIINIADPVNPSVVASVDVPYETTGIYVQGNYAYAAAGASGLQIIDIADPASPAVAATVDIPGYDAYRAYEVYVQDSFAYVATASGLRIIDIANHTKPKTVGSVDALGKTRDVFVQGNYAYAAAGDSGLKVIKLKSAASEIKTIEFIDEHTISAVIPKGLLPGMYDIRIVSQSGGEAISYDALTIRPPTPTVFLTADKRNGEAPLTVNFTATAQDDGTIVKYQWDFDGDGQYDDEIGTGTVAEASYTYQTPGTYRAAVMVVDDDGLKKKTVIVISVSESSQENGGGGGGCFLRSLNGNGLRF